VIVTGAPTGDLAGLWPLFGLVIETPRLGLRLPREDELPALTRAARDIAGPEGPRLWPRAVPAYARPGRLRGPGMRRTPATGQRQLTRKCTAPPAEETA
jgi:hypothetical protein